MTDLIERQSALLKSVESAVNDHWRNFSRAFMMPQLGTFIRRDFPDFANIAPQGLKRLLISHPVVNIIEYPGMPEKVGAVPLSVHIPHDVRSLFRGAEDFTHTGPIYEPDFWRSFHTVPPSEGRVVIVDAAKSTFRIGDRNSQGEDGEQCYPIESSDVANTSETDSLQAKVDATKAMIAQWLGKHSLESTLFTRKTEPHEVERNARRHSPAENSFGGDRLTSALAKLKPADQARIMIPLDIVIKMLG